MELHVALPMIGGIIIILGSFLLLYKGKLAFKAEEKAVLVVDIPQLGSIRAASASLGLFIVGALLLIVPFLLTNNWWKEKTELTNEIEKLKDEGHKIVTINGLVKSENFPIGIYAAGKQAVLNTGGEFSLRVPVSVDPNFSAIWFKD